MTLKELRYLVARGEGHHLEFKRKVSFPEKILKEMIAFANSSGGTLLLGVNDEGHLSGLKYPDEEIYVLTEALRKFCRPQLHYEIEVVPIDGKKSIVSFTVPESVTKPHYLIDQTHTNKKVAYIRYQDKSLKASREVRQILSRKNHSHGVMIRYGEAEKKLLLYLQEHGQITLAEFAGLIDRPVYHASRTLILLVLANVLDVLPREGADLYILNREAS